MSRLKVDRIILCQKSILYNLLWFFFYNFMLLFFNTSQADLEQKIKHHLFYNTTQISQTLASEKF